jgi:hypothetical protein
MIKLHKFITVIILKNQAKYAILYSIFHSSFFFFLFSFIPIIYYLLYSIPLYVSTHQTFHNSH